MLKAIDVANYIVDYVSDNHSSEKLTHVKLQKIIYYIYATFLKNTNDYLFDEPIEKWQYGPVVRSVYDQFKSFGYSTIDRPQTELCMKIADNGAVEFTYEDFDKSVVEANQNIVETIQNVVDKLINIDAFKLVDMTHEEESWKNFLPLIKQRAPNLFYTDEDIYSYSKDVLNIQL